MSVPARKLPIEWYRGCTTPEEKEARDFLVRNNTLLFTLFLSILRAKAETIEKKGYKEEDYEDSNWVFLQAFRNGKMAQLDEIAELFSFMTRN